MVKTTTLALIASCGGVLLVSTNLLLQDSLRQKVYNTDLHRAAMKTLRAHPGAIHILGEPIKEKAFKINPKKNFCTDGKAQFEIPVSGSNENGTYYFWANQVDDKWLFSRAELGLKKDPSRRLIIIKDNNSTDETES